MLLVFITAILAVCGAAKLDRTYLPPLSAKTAGGRLESLLAPVETTNTPIGSYVNEEQGVVVDAVIPGTRNSDEVPTGLGASRTSYGSINSKVGDAAFEAPQFGPNIATRIAPGFDSITGVKENKGVHNLRILPISDPSLEKTGTNNVQSHGNTLKFNNEISKEQYSYGYETDNGILVGENGVARDGIEANGGYSYEGDDGKVYSVSYTADKEGYRPKGNHLPTPPPIPLEIVKSLEDNARDEAKGIVDDGSYDAQKYNIESNNSSNNDDSNKNHSSTNKGPTNSFIVSHGKYTSQSNSGIPVVNSQSTEFHYTQNSYKYSAPSFSGHGFGNKHSGFGVNHNLEHNRFGFSSQYGPHTTALPSLSNVPSHPDVGDSFASAVASTGSNVDNEQLIKSQSNLNRTPISPAENSAYSSATVIGSGSASASSSTAPNQASIENNNPLHIKTFEEFEQESIFRKGPFTIESGKASTSIPTLTSASATVSGNQDNIVKAGGQRGNFKEKSSTIYKQYHNLEIPSAHPTLGFPTVPPTKVPTLELSTPFEPNKSSGAELGTIDSLIFSPQSTLTSSKHQLSQFDSTSELQNVQHLSQFPQTSIDQTATNYASFGPSILNSVHRQRGNSLYYYNQPSKTFITPVPGVESVGYPSQPTVSSVPPQKSTSWVNIPISKLVSSTALPQFGQIEGSKSTSFYNGITHASTQPQETLSQTHGSQLQKGTLYEYNKPATYQNTGHSSNIKTFTSTSQQIPQQQQSQETLRQTHGSHLQQDTLYEYNKPTTYQQSAHTSNIKSFSPTSQQTLQQKQPQETLSQTHGSQLQKGTLYEYNKPATYQNTGHASNIKTFTSTSQKIPQQQQSQQSLSQTHDSQLQQGTLYEYNKPSIYQQTAHTSNIKGFTSTSQEIPQQQQSQETQGSQLQQGTLYEYNKPATYQNTAHASNVNSFTTAINKFDQKTERPGSSSFALAQNSESKVGEKIASHIETEGKRAELDSVVNIKHSTQASPQQNQGTIYQYNKPSGTIFSNKETSNIFQTSGDGVDTITQIKTQSQDDKNILTEKGTSSLSQLGKTTAKNGQTTQRNTNSDQNTFGTTFGQNLQPNGIKGQYAQLTSNSGQKPFGSTQKTGTTFSQSSFGRTSGSQFGQKPQPVVVTKGKSDILNPWDSKFVSGSFQSTQKGSSSLSQFEETTPVKGQSTPQIINSGLKPFSSYQTTGSALSQNTFGSTSGSQFGQNSQTSGIKDQSTQKIGNSGQKPFSSSQTTGSEFSQNTFGSASGSQFGQNTQPIGIKGQSTQQTSNSGQKPFSSSQTIGSALSQNAFESASGSQFGKNLQPNGIKGQSTQQTDKSDQKPSGSSQTTGSAFSQNAFGSTFGTQFGQNLQTSGVKDQSTQQTSNSGQKPFSSSQTTGYEFSQNTFGSSSVSQFGQNIQPTSIKGQSTQQTGNSGQKPFGSSQTLGSTFSQNTFGSTSGSQFGHNIQTTGKKGQSTQQTSNFDQKPFSSPQTTGSAFSQKAFGSASGFQIDQNIQPTGIKGQATQQTGNSGQKPFGSTQTTGTTFFQSSLGSTSGSQFGQKPQLVVGTKEKSDSLNLWDFKFVSGSLQSTQKGSSSLSQFRQTTPVKGQSTPQFTNSGQKPFGSSQTTGSALSQNTFGNTFGSQFEQNLQPNGIKGQSTQQTGKSDQKPSGSSQTTGSAFSQNAFGSTFGTQFGQNLQTTGIKGQSTQQTSNFGQKPFRSSQTTDSTLSQNTFGSTSGSQFEQNSQTTGIKGQSTQLLSNSGQKNFSSSQSGFAFSQKALGSITGSQFGQNIQPTGIKGQSTQQTGNSGQKPSGSTQTTGTTFSQSSLGSTSGSQFGQKPQLVVGTKEKSDSLNPWDFKFVSGSLQSTQKGSSSLSQFGQTTPVKGQSTPQFTNSGQKPFGSSQTTGSALSQNTFGNTFGSQFEQNLQPNGIKGQSTQQTGKSDQKPSGSSQTTGSAFSQNAFGSTFGTQFGQNLQTTGIKGQSTQQTSNFGQKPFRSSQTTDSTLSQNTFGSTSGSQFEQNSQTTGIKGQSTQLLSNSGQKNFSSSQSGFAFSQKALGSITGSQFGQNIQPTGIKGQSTQQTGNSGQKPSGSTQTTGTTFSQSSFVSTTGSQFGQKPQLVEGIKGKSDAQKSSSLLSQFGQTTDIKGETTQQNAHAGQKPFGSSQIPNSAFSQNAFGSPSGSQFGQNVQSTGIKGQSTQKTGDSGQKPFSSSQSTGFAFAQKAFGTSSGSQFGQDTQPAGIKGQSTQQTSNTAQKPFSSSQTIGSALSQNAFGSASGSQFGQNVQPTHIKDQSTHQSINAGQKPFSHTTGSAFSQNTFGSASGSQFSQTIQPTSIKGQSTQNTSPSGQHSLGSSQITSSSFSQNTYGSTLGPQFGPVVGTKDLSTFHNSQIVGSKLPQTKLFGQNLQAGVGSSASATAQVQPSTQTGVKSVVDTSEIKKSFQEAEKEFGSKFTVASFQSTQSESSKDIVNSEDSQIPDSLNSPQFSSVSSQFNTKLNTPVVSQYKHISEQRPVSTASAFASLNSGSNIDVIPDPVYQYTQFRKVESETLKPFVNKDSFKIGDSNPSLNLGSFEHKQSSSQAFASSRPTVNFSTKTKVIPATQISIDQLRSAAANAKSTFNEKSSQATSTHVNLPSTFKAIPSLNLRSQDSSTLTSAVSTAQTLTSSINYSNKPDSIFVGKKEEFAERREPPTFDIKTGYHY